MTDKEKDLIWLVVVFVVLIVILPVLMMWGMWGGGFMHGMMGYGGYGWWFMPLIPLAFLVLLVLGVYYLLKEYTRPRHEERALEILKERYAKGEITREEYMKLKEELES
jgi:putative membrane protein